MPATRSLAALTLVAAMTATPASASASAATVRDDALNLATKTTYTLQPMNFNIEDSMTPSLQGKMCDQGQCSAIDHPASLGTWSIKQGADNLHTMLTSDDKTDVIVFARSQGAQAVTEWMGQHAGELDAAENLTFVLLGNPERETGFRAQNNFTDPTPTDTRFTVIDITRQYDGWADWPDHFNVLAIMNATMGMTSIHNDYESIDAPASVDEIHASLADDPNGAKNLVWKKDNTYYVVNKTDILPIARPLTWIGMNDAAKKLSDQLRPTIESAYDRPANGTGIEGTPEIGDVTIVQEPAPETVTLANNVVAENTSLTNEARTEKIISPSDRDAVERKTTPLVSRDTIKESVSDATDGVDVKTPSNRKRVLSEKLAATDKDAVQSVRTSEKPFADRDKGGDSTAKRRDADESESHNRMAAAPSSVSTKKDTTDAGTDSAPGKSSDGDETSSSDSE